MRPWGAVFLAAAIVASSALGRAEFAPQLPARDAVGAPTFGTASISGIVVNDEQQPKAVRRAIVSLTGSGLQPSRGAITDDQGRFSIRNLPAGRFTLTVWRAGFITSIFGATRPGRRGTPIPVASGGTVDDLVVRIWRGAAVAGVIRDDSGAPVAGIPVQAMPRRPGAGAAPTLSNNGTTTNAFGEYRIFGLAPGSYVIGARPPTGTTSLLAPTEDQVDAALAELRQGKREASSPAAPGSATAGRSFTYAPVYFPGTAFLDLADGITLEPGDERTGLDFSLLRITTATVDGVVTRPDGQPAAHTDLQLTPLPRTNGPPSAPSIVNATSTDAEGHFRIPQVIPGDYRLVAREPVASAPSTIRTASGLIVSTGGPAGPMLWAQQQVSVAGSDVSGLVMGLEPGAKVEGHVEFDGTAPPPAGNLTQLRVWFMPVDGIVDGRVETIAFVPATPLRPDGTFAIESLPPGRFTLRVFDESLDSTPWGLRSAMAGSRDLLDGVVDIPLGAPLPHLALRYTDRPTELSGTFRTSTGAPVSAVYVIAFATDRTMWGAGNRRVMAVRPGIDGRYVMNGLPPGEYYLGAVTDIDENDWEDPGFLQTMIPASVTVTITEGERRVQDLTLAGK